jgi:putative ABC transport system substrate-binding protein
MKRAFLWLATAIAFAPFHSLEAQPTAKVYRVGILEGSPPQANARLWEAFRQGLRELGYVEGKNLIFEHRSAEGKRDRLSGLADELVRLNVDVILTAATPPALAAKKATNTIPIVMVTRAIQWALDLSPALAGPGET